MTPAQLIMLYDHIRAGQEGTLTTPTFAFKDRRSIEVSLAARVKGKGKAPARKKAALDLAKEDERYHDFTLEGSGFPSSDGIEIPDIDENIAATSQSETQLIRETSAESMGATHLASPTLREDPINTQLPENEVHQADGPVESQAAPKSVDIQPPAPSISPVGPDPVAVATQSKKRKRKRFVCKFLVCLFSTY